MEAVAGQHYCIPLQLIQRASQSGGARPTQHSKRPRVWVHGYIKFLLEDCGSDECPTSSIPEFVPQITVIAKPSVERVADAYRNFYLRLRRAIPGN